MDSSSPSPSSRGLMPVAQYGKLVSSVLSHSLVDSLQSSWHQSDEPTKGTRVGTVAARCTGVTCRVDVLEAAEMRADGFAGRSPGVLFAALPGSPSYATVLAHEKLKIISSKSPYRCLGESSSRRNHSCFGDRKDRAGEASQVQSPPGQPHQTRARLQAL